MLGQFRIGVLARDRRPGGAVEIVRQSGESVVRGRDLRHDPLTFRIAYFAGDCPSFFSAIQPISFVPYELRGRLRLGHGLTLPTSDPASPRQNLGLRDKYTVENLYAIVRNCNQ